MLEALAYFLVTQQMSWQELQRQRPIELRVFGLVDDAHPALAELIEDFVVADGLANQDAPILRSCNCRF